MRLLISAIAMVALVAGAAALAAGPTKRDPTAYLYIGWPNNGEVMQEARHRVWFGLRNMGVAPAGVEVANTGHHHLLIDTDLPPLRRTDPQRREPSAFRQGPDRNHDRAAAGKHTLQLSWATRITCPSIRR